MKEDNIEERFWVFVSHSTKDFERVRLVRNALENSGFRPILFYLKCLENENEVNDLLKEKSMLGSASFYAIVPMRKPQSLFNLRLTISKQNNGSTK